MQEAGPTKHRDALHRNASRHGAPRHDAAKPARARDRVFDTACDLFYRKGIRAVGVEEIVSTANVSKISLYRSFPSKDELVAAYLEARSAWYWRWWDEVTGRHPGDPKAQLLAVFRSLVRKVTSEGYRGCPFANSATEFPDPGHPGRRIAEANKRELRARLAALCRELGARDPALLADQLLLLMEGAYAIGQSLGTAEPVHAVVQAADALIEAQSP